MTNKNVGIGTKWVNWKEYSIHFSTMAINAYLTQCILLEWYVTKQLCNFDKSMTTQMT